MTKISDPVLGLLLVAASELVFASASLVVSLAPLPLLVTTEARYLATWLLSVVLLVHYRADGLHPLGPPGTRGLLVFRGALCFVVVTAWWAALRRAPVGNCVALLCCGPVLSALWSRLLLGERLLHSFPLQVFLALAGALLVLDPQFLHPGPPKDAAPGHDDYSLVLVSVVLISFVPVVTKETRSCSWIEVEHVATAMASFVLNPALVGIQCLIAGHPPEVIAVAPSAALLTAAAALCAAAGVSMQTRGYQLAEPGRAAMLLYLQVPFAYGLQLAFTHAPVRLQAVLGSLLIFASVAVSVAEQRLLEGGGPSVEDAPEDLVRFDPQAKTWTEGGASPDVFEAELALFPEKGVSIWSCGSSDRWPCCPETSPFLVPSA